jgi:SAM-dependent methyltransferase
MRSDALTSKEYWQQQTAPFVPFLVTGNPFAELLERYLPVDPALSCVEIGAYPGSYLCYLAKRFGYQATAIEYRPDAGDIATLFAFNGLQPPEVINADFFEIEGLQFDVVSSFGFAEHFTDMQKVVDCHAKLLRPGGRLVLSMPQVRSYQWLVRRLAYTREAFSELHATHNLPVMRLNVIRRAIEQAGLEIEYAGYAMNARLWVRSDSPRVRRSAKRFVGVLTWIDLHIGHRLPSCVLYSPMIFTVARKPDV